MENKHKAVEWEDEVCTREQCCSRKHDKGLQLSGMTLSRMRDRWICGKPLGCQVGSARCGQLAGALDVEVWKWKLGL